MKILLLSDVYFPRVNGVSTSIRTFAESLAGMGHAVTIVAPDYGNASGQAEHDGGGAYDVIRLPSRKVFFDPEDRLITGAALRAALARLEREPWDVIHVHTPFRAHRLGVKLARRIGRPIVETYHTHFEEYVGLYLPWLPSGLLRAFARNMSRRLCHEVDHIIVPSPQMVEVLHGYGIQTPHTVLPTGIDLAQFRAGSGAAFRLKHRIADDRPTLVTVSRLAREKNIGFLVEVTQRLLAEFPDLLFIVAGEGPDSERLKQLVTRQGLGDNVRFFGNLDRRSELLDCYRAGDVFVFASPTETQGLVLVEAMALGRPIVSTAVLGTATVLKDAGGARISREDPVEFAFHIAELLRSPEQREMLSAESLIDARIWSAEALMQRVVDLYASLAATASGRFGDTQQGPDPTGQASQLRAGVGQ
jgi:glycosyltransferase involved in cell wall biosynthesis